MTEGEEYIADFLESESIAYEKEVVIKSLKGDSKNHRKADFYIPKYKVYIEFFGQWNSEAGKERYREKKTVYKNNSIPCIYLYPENLGIIEYVFHKRLTTELISYNMTNELWKYRLNEIWKERFDSFLLIAFSVFVLYYNYPWFNKENLLWSIIGGGVFLYHLSKIYRTANQILKYGPKNRRIFY